MYIYIYQLSYFYFLNNIYFIKFNNYPIELYSIIVAVQK